MSRLLLGAVLLVCLLVPGSAHHATSGWEYPLWCCHDRDCIPLASDDVFEAPDFFGIYSTGETIMRADAMRSGDGGFHICRAPSGKVRCFFYPDRGS